MTKQCSKCKETKNLEDFHRFRRNKDGRQAWCKKCRTKDQKARYAANPEPFREHARARYAANPERHKKYARAWYAANRERVIDAAKAWDKANRERANARTVSYKKARMAADPFFRMRANLRGRLRKAVHRNQRAGSAVRDLGCSIKFLRQHLEGQFTEEMSWENHGIHWQIDHIFPLNKADLTDRVEFLAVNNWRNLRPLIIEENNSKSDKVNPAARRLFNQLVAEFQSREEAA
jgi:hypothetical protein